ncbi:MAG: PfkB family carbohydrate kinase [Pseudomonadota bacterium]
MPTTTEKPGVLCLGSALWDVIGRTDRDMPYGADRPGRVQRVPGGVAMNIAMALARRGHRPALLTHVGEDDEGRALLAEAEAQGLETAFVTRSPNLPTDRYMAIEGPGGLVAAIADAHALEAAGDAILAPLADGRLGSAAEPYAGLVAIDGNLTGDVLESFAASPLFAKADLRIAPASPGKAERLRPLLGSGRTTIYVNLEEAGLLAGADFSAARQAAEALAKAGARRVLVTDGPRAACALFDGEAFVAMPPPTAVRRVTGAGDMFMAAHIAAELASASAEDALNVALKAAAAHVAGGART